MLRRKVSKRKEASAEAADTKSALTKRTKKSASDSATRRSVLGESEKKDEAEKILEQLVLGGEDHLSNELQKRSAVAPESVAEADSHKPVWEDEDDSTAELVPRKDRQPGLVHVPVPEKKLKGQQYKEKLKNQFEKVSGTCTPSWARLRWEKANAEKDDSDDDDEEILKSTGDYLAGTDNLPRTTIQMKKCRDGNKEDHVSSTLKSVEFHPTAQVMLAAAVKQTLSLFQVDGKSNPKIQSIFLENYPIHTAHFTRDGREIIVGSTRKGFLYYDMIAGKVVKVPAIQGLEEHTMKRFVMSPDGSWAAFMGDNGNIHLISAKSKEWLWSLKMNGSVESVCFSPDATRMYSHGDGGEVYIWDLRKRDCVHRFRDEGCTQGLSVTCSPNGQYLAAGSYSGVVNIYDESIVTNSKDPKPLKAIQNLTSPCTNLVFNPTSEILALASNYTENAVKLVHFPSLTVFSNFPAQETSLKIPQCMDFSVNSGYFTIGNNKGQAKLYRVKHYGNY